MPTPTDDDVREEDTHDEYNCHDSPLWTLLLTASSVMLGYLVGRVTYNRDLRAVLRRIEESPEPVEFTIRTV